MKRLKHRRSKTAYHLCRHRLWLSLRGSKKYLIYWDKQKLLQKTTTNTGSGVNPLSLEEVQVKEWQVQAVDSKRATLSFLLCSKSRSLRVKQQLYFYNAEVIGDE